MNKEDKIDSETWVIIIIGSILMGGFLIFAWYLFVPSGCRNNSQDCINICNLVHGIIISGLIVAGYGGWRISKGEMPLSLPKRQKNGDVA